jgi:hypothetical protein
VSAFCTLRCISSCRILSFLFKLLCSDKLNTQYSQNSGTDLPPLMTGQCHEISCTAESGSRLIFQHLFFLTWYMYSLLDTEKCKIYNQCCFRVPPVCASCTTIERKVKSADIIVCKLSQLGRSWWLGHSSPNHQGRYIITGTITGICVVRFFECQHHTTQLG